MKIRVRPMQVDDVPLAVLIDAMCMPVPWSERAYRAELKTSYSRPWAAERVITGSEPLVYQAPAYFEREILIRQPGETALVGMLVLWHILDEAHIATVAVHPQVRRQGIGHCLVQTALEQAVVEGAVRVLLEVRAGNLVAQQLYSEFGFEVVGRRRGYYRDNDEDALLMNLEDLPHFTQRLVNKEKHG
ncbi:MAG: ribosomal protein S18-alanine N-acetyltransferase [Anaerolineales bacterium]|nr:ribosomal protein S18-alanine N-acetyltransferase [Anaerolineales bacterium]